jgi:hypothetical protein
MKLTNIAAAITGIAAATLALTPPAHADGLFITCPSRGALGLSLAHRPHARSLIMCASPGSANPATLSSRTRQSPTRRTDAEVVVW